MLNIIARKPRGSGWDGEYVIVDRGEGLTCRFVSATVNQQSLKNGEWFWGHYFASETEAIKHFESRGVPL